MSIPLVQNNDKDSINTSLNAIKRNLDRINSMLGLVDNTTAGIENEIALLQPVDTVASGNLHSVTSNAVAGAISTEVSNRNTAITNAINTEVTNRNNAIANANNCSWTEHATGSTWVDGRPIYERTVYIENIVNGTYTYVYNVYASEIISYSGYALVGSDKYLIPCRWLGFYPVYPHFKIYNYDLGTANAIVTFRYVK